ncbi:MAG: hypothetical protein K9N10_01590 [Deltaproteobacteria bacterium]|nr:hypothetical protein [Deltaproteobacteria bacterium]
MAENIHGDTERIDIRSVIHTAKAYALFPARWCPMIDRCGLCPKTKGLESVVHPEGNTIWELPRRL